MATKQMLSQRLDTAVISELQRLATERKTDVNGVISQALDSLSRNDGGSAVAEQMKNFEASIRGEINKKFEIFEGILVRLIEVISPFGSLLTETEDRAFRAWKNSKLSLEWSHLIVKNGGMPSVEQWREKFTKLLTEIDKERATIKEARQQGRGKK